MLTVALDFAPGLHGHFLEYILNRYIFKITADVDSIFQSSGACHPINTDKIYLADKIVRQRHYSSFDIDYPADTKKIIFIQRCARQDFILLTNMYHRCHPDSINVTDFNVDEIKKLQESMMLAGSNQELKNDWYSKLLESRFELADQQPITDLPVFNFAYESFFALDEFLLEIKKTADFLEQTFDFDRSLVKIWKEFIQRNQGYHAWVHGNELFAHVVAGNDVAVIDDWKIHAYLNYKISTIFSLHDHPDLFGLGTYPTSTKQIHDIIMDHMSSFDNRW
jgi:hypothetical protein